MQQFWYSSFIWLSSILRTRTEKKSTPILIHFRANPGVWQVAHNGIDFKLAVLIYRCLHGLAPQYLSDNLQHIADSNCRCLRSLSLQLVIRHTPLSTVGDCTFPVAGSCLWNLSSNADCFSEPPQNSSLFPIISFLTVFDF